MLNNLYPYINNPEDPAVNFQLAQEYDAMGQTASALGFYLRCAERSTDDQQQYTALLHCALCFERQRCREGTEKTLLLKAIALLPTRPEAYFLLSRLHEILKEWQECYTVSCLGLAICDPTVAENTTVEYPGTFALLFQKGVSAWWVGHCEESREIMEELKFHYPMNEFFTQIVNNNLASIGYPNTTIVYTGDRARQLRYQFPGADTIDKNYSQSLQDMFVLSATDGLQGGTYVEIGSAEPFYNNNTALLETAFGWTGISLDIDQAKVTDFNNKRNNPALCLDATTANYSKLFQQNRLPDVIDYLQIDCEPPETSFKILQSIPFNRYRFRVITFEHDAYYNPTVKDQSRDFLRACGYQLVAGDIAYNQKNSYEDWWCRADLIDATVLAKLIDTVAGVKFARDYLLSSSAPI